jgi:hypothetical protein
VTVDLVGVGATEGGAGFMKPVEEGDTPKRRLVRGEKAGGQASNLVGGEDDVTHCETYEAR